MPQMRALRDKARCCDWSTTDLGELGCHDLEIEVVNGGTVLTRWLLQLELSVSSRCECRDCVRSARAHRLCRRNALDVSQILLNLEGMRRSCSSTSASSPLRCRPTTKVIASDTRATTTTTNDKRVATKVFQTNPLGSRDGFASGLDMS